MKNFFLKENKWQTWVLLFLILTGVFFRTYHFQKWLQFGDDQIRDANLVRDVTTGKSPLPLIGPFMSFSGEGDHGEQNSFHMGPIYYYFQIASAKIFGNYPDKLAYPDVLFAILSLPLIYFFFSSYFSRNISLVLVGLYSVSAYFITYSRFAWNTNLIPFFILALLLCLHKIWEKNEKTSWWWFLACGLALGVGFQLHAIEMITFSLVTFFVFLISMKTNWRIWKKWAIVLAMFLLLNSPQIISEFQSRLHNTKTLLGLAAGNGSRSSIDFSKLKNDIDCHLESNFFFVSSYGNEQCEYHFIVSPVEGWKNHYFASTDGYLKFILLIVTFIFSIAGYFLLGYFLKKEKDPAKKKFLLLVLVYFGTGFLVMLPLSKNSINDLRYYDYAFFIPYIFVGLITKFLLQKTKKKSAKVGIIIFISLLVGTNVQALYLKIDTFRHDAITCTSLYKTTLGELQPIVDYMTEHSEGRSSIYLEKDNSHRVMPDALAYLLNLKNIDLIKVSGMSSEVPIDSTRFLVSCAIPRKLPEGTSLKIYDMDFDQKIGLMYVYPLKSD